MRSTRVSEFVLRFLGSGFGGPGAREGGLEFGRIGWMDEKVEAWILRAEGQMKGGGAHGDFPVTRRTVSCAWVNG